MGGEPYWYIVDYEKDLQEVLNKLREREFKAGRYNPVISDLSGHFEGEKYLKLSPGNKHKSIEEAVEAAQESLTRSILDINKIGDEPNYFVASPLDESSLETIFGTDKPTPQMVEENIDSVLEEIDRGMCRYFLLYKKDKPVKICFAGYSFD